MAFSRRRSMRRRPTGPRYLWRRTSFNISQTTSSNSVILVNGATLAGLTTGTFFEGTEVLVKAVRFEIHDTFAHTGAGSTGTNVFIRYGLYIDRELTPGVLLTARDVNWPFESDVQADWMDVWSSEYMALPPVNVEPVRTFSAHSANERKVKVSRRMRANDYIGFSYSVIAANNAASIGTGYTYAARAFLSVLVKHLRPL